MILAIDHIFCCRSLLHLVFALEWASITDQAVLRSSLQSMDDFALLLLLLPTIPRLPPKQQREYSCILALLCRHYTNGIECSFLPFCKGLCGCPVPSLSRSLSVINRTAVACIPMPLDRFVKKTRLDRLRASY